MAPEILTTARVIFNAVIDPMSHEQVLIIILVYTALGKCLLCSS